MEEIPYKNFNIGKDTVICQNHWPKDYCFGERLSETWGPLTIFPGVPKSCFPTLYPKSRSAHRTSLVGRGSQPATASAIVETGGVTAGKLTVGIFSAGISAAWKFCSGTLVNWSKLGEFQTTFRQAGLARQVGIYDPFMIHKISIGPANLKSQ